MLIDLTAKPTLSFQCLFGYVFILSAFTKALFSTLIFEGVITPFMYLGGKSKSVSEVLVGSILS